MQTRPRRAARTRGALAIALLALFALLDQLPLTTAIISGAP